MPSIYAIDAEMKFLMAEIAAAEGEITEEQEGKLSQLKLDRYDKLASMAQAIRTLELEEEKFEKEASRILAIKNDLGKKREKITDLMRRALGEANDWSNGFFTARWVKSKAVEISREVDVKTLPERFIRYEEKYTPDKRELKKALEEGEIIDGVELVTRYHFHLE